MQWSQLLLADLKGSLEQRLGLLILPLDIVKTCQVVEAPRCVGMIRSQLLLADGQDALVQRLGLFVLVLNIVEQSEIGYVFRQSSFAGKTRMYGEEEQKMRRGT